MSPWVVFHLQHLLCCLALPQGTRASCQHPTLARARSSSCRPASRTASEAPLASAGAAALRSAHSPSSKHAKGMNRCRCLRFVHSVKLLEHRHQQRQTAMGRRMVNQSNEPSSSSRGAFSSPLFPLGSHGKASNRVSNNERTIQRYRPLENRQITLTLPFADEDDFRENGRNRGVAQRRGMHVFG